MDIDRIYEDEDGIRYKVVGFSDQQYEMKIVDSPYSEIHEGITVKSKSLPKKIVNKS